MRQVPMLLTDFQKSKLASQKICFLTCYDYPSALMVADTNVDCVLVGDSVAMVVHGYASTVSATVEMMVLHTKAVAKGIKHQFIVTDLPFLTQRLSRSELIHSVQEIMHAGAQAIKIEGGDEETCTTITSLVGAGVPVMGHIGYTPQSVHLFGKNKVVGKDLKQAQRLIEQAHALEAAGCFAIVLECVPEALAKQITNALSIPTIGIGAGIHTDGQVLVWHDMLGLQTEFKPRFVKQFALAKPILTEAIQHFAHEVHHGAFPEVMHSFVRMESV